ncbi:MAG: acetyl-CoA C-acyltransferase [Planctomycetota bacterium]|nr:acetyl-CoA C-acyltransferase [Planctomycetota bacterium]
MKSATRDPATTPVIVGCCRTAIGRSHPERGVFRHVRGDELAAAVTKAVVESSGVDPDTIEDVVFGATQQRGEQGGNVARCAALMAGLPFAAAGTSINRLCGSSLQALAQACHAIAAGAENVQVVGGVEHMQHLPMDSAIDIHPQVFARSSRGMLSMGMTAEHLAAAHGISRQKQEAFALESHRRAAAATAAGLFADEIVPVFGHDEAGSLVEATRDQSIRPDTSLEAMAALEPAFLPRVGTVTAATSAPLSDGAAALLVMSAAEAERLGLAPLVRVIGTAVVGVPPAVMGTGPVPAVRKLLDRTGLTLADIDLVELNEAFAAQAIHCIETLGLDEQRVNVWGGSLAIGHPLGASGARITTTLVSAMRHGDARLGIATMCIGLGQGIAVACERME